VINWGLVSTILGVIFFITTIVLAIRLTRRKKPVWAYKTTKIIGLDTDAPLELKLTFNEQLVTDVYRTKVILFNKGNEAILKDNITESIVIHFQGANILQQPTILATSKEGIGASAKQVVKGGDNAIELSFQYLDHNDGSVAEVLHTLSDNITCSGNIIGVGQPVYIGEFTPSYPERFASRLIAHIVMFLLPILCFLVVLLTPESTESTESSKLGLRGTLILFSVFTVIWWGHLATHVIPFFRYIKFPRWSDDVGGKAVRDKLEQRKK